MEHEQLPEKYRCLIVSEERGTQRVLIHVGEYQSLGEYLTYLRGIESEGHKVRHVFGPTLSLDMQLESISALGRFQEKPLPEISTELDERIDDFRKKIVGREK